jgi:hypothetical protein
VINEYLDGLPGEHRKLAHTEWGLTLEAENAGGWPCDMSLRIDDQLLRVQAYALEANEALDPKVLLQWNRQTRLVRFGQTRSGDIWVLGDLSVQAVDAKGVDRLLGLITEGVLAVRGYARALTEPAEPAGGWLRAPQ